MKRNPFILLCLILGMLMLPGVAAAQDYNPDNPPEPDVPVVTQYSVLTVEASPAEGGTVSPATPQRLKTGTRVTLRATAAYRHRFVRWRDADGNTLSDRTDFDYTVAEGNPTVTAEFEFVPYDPSNPDEPDKPDIVAKHVLKVVCNPAGAASVYGGGTYDENSSHHIETRYPETYYSFVNWTDDEGTEVSTTANFDYTMPARDVTLTANYRYDFNPGNPDEPGYIGRDYTLTLKSDPAGRGTFDRNATSTVREGSDITVTATPKNNYAFVNWTDAAGNEVSTSASYRFNMPASDLELTAHFVLSYDPENPGDPDRPDVDNQFDPDKVFEPRFTSYPTVSDGSRIMVTLTCETPGAVMYYTVDGSEPTAASTLYTAPFEVASNLMVRAIAYKEGMKDSRISYYNVSPFKCNPPEITYGPKRTVVMTPHDTADAIYYTTDFTDPTRESTLYSGPFVPGEDVRIKAISVREGYGDSEITTYSYRIVEHMAEEPAFSYDESTGMLTLTTATAGASIAYTADGSEPTEESALYTAPLAITGNCTVKAIAFSTDLYPSHVAEWVMDDFRVAEPVISFAGRKVAITCATSGAEVRYTLDGSEPTGESILYEGPFVPENDCTVTAAGFKEGAYPSQAVTFAFVRADLTAAAPAFSFDETSSKLAMTSATAGATIVYTTDGSEPTEDGTVYTAPLDITGNCTVKAMAFTPALFPSAVTSWTNDGFTVETPVISYAARSIEIACPTEDAVIRYTLDGTVPTETSEIYTEAIPMTGDCTITATGFRDGFNPSASAVYHFIMADHRVATPTFSFDETASALTIASATEGATIIYTTDGTEPTVDSAVYTAPLDITENCTVKAMAFTEDLFPSAVTSWTNDGFTVETPVISYANRSIKITCPTEGAVVRYTLDGTVPIKTSEVYTAPIPMTGDCTITATGFRDGFNPSASAEYRFVMAEHRVAAPTFSFDETTSALTIASATEGATIVYTTDRTEPNVDSAVYIAPLDITENCTVKAMAFTEDLFPSAVTVWTNYGFTVETPIISYAARALEITCGTEEAEIRYTLDGTIPTVTGELYTGAIPMSSDCTVTAIGFKEGYNDSDPAYFDFMRERFTTADVEFEPYHKEGIIRIVPTGDTTGQELEVTLHYTGSADEATGEDVIKVDRDMVIAARMTSPDLLEREPRVFEARRAERDVEIGNLGTELVFYTEAVMVVDTPHGTIETQGAMPNPGPGIIHVRNYIPGELFISDPMPYEVRFDYDGERRVRTIGPNVFAEALPIVEDNCELVLEGRLSGNDTRLLSGMPDLHALDLSGAEMDNPLLADMPRLRRIALPSAGYPDGNLSDCPSLGSLVWASGEAMDENVISGIGNPNLIVYAAERRLVPDAAGNVVVNGHTDRLTLTEGHAFDAAQDFTASEATFAKTFSKTTNPGGWETIILPYDVTDIRHESKGAIAPFTDARGMAEGKKPFWLATMAETVEADGVTPTYRWTDCDSIKADTPYIIAMPNNDDYIWEYNLDGTVHFSARDVKIRVSDTAEPTLPYFGNREMHGTYVPVYEEEVYFSMNAKGDAFTEGSGAPSPFECWFTGMHGENSIGIAPGSSTIDNVGAAGSGLEIRIIDGNVWMRSGRDREVTVYTVTGVASVTVTLRADEPQRLQSLVKGVYIADGQKFTVK